MLHHFVVRVLAILVCVALAIAQPVRGESPLVIKAHPAGAPSVAFSPEGKQLVTGASRGWFRILGVEGGRMIGEVKIWDAATGQKIADVPGLKAAVASVAFSPDGKFLAAGCGGNDEDGKDYTVYMWEVDGYKLRHKIPLAGPATAVAFSPDSKLLAAGIGEGRNGELSIVWDVESGKELHQLHTAGMRGYRRVSIAFAPNKEFLITARGSGGVIGAGLEIWNLATGRSETTVAGSGEPLSVAWSPDGKLLAAGGPGSDISLYTAPRGTLLRKLEGHTDKDLSGVFALAFSPDSQTLASGGADSDIRLWPIVAGKKGDAKESDSLVLRGHTALVRTLAFSPDGKRLASSSNDHTVRVWDVAAEDSAK